MDPPGCEKSSHGESREDCGHDSHDCDHIQVRVMSCVELTLPPLLWGRVGRSRRTQREAFVGQDWHPGESGRNAGGLDHRRFSSQTEEADTSQRARKHHRARRDWYRHQNYWDSPPAAGAAWVSRWHHQLFPFDRHYPWCFLSMKPMKSPLSLSHLCWQLQQKMLPQILPGRFSDH